MEVPEKLQSVIPSFTSFASVGCIRDAVILEVDWYMMMSLNLGFAYGNIRHSTGESRLRTKGSIY